MPNENAIQGSPQPSKSAGLSSPPAQMRAKEGSDSTATSKQTNEPECNHEWELKCFDSANFYFKCRKCGLEGRPYKCKRCDNYTPHKYVKYLGERMSRRTGYPIYTRLEEWRCLICGSTRLVSKVEHIPGPYTY